MNDNLETPVKPSAEIVENKPLAQRMKAMAERAWYNSYVIAYPFILVDIGNAAFAVADRNWGEALKELSDACLDIGLTWVWKTQLEQDRLGAAAARQIKKGWETRRKNKAVSEAAGLPPPEPTQFEPTPVPNALTKALE